MGIATGLKRGTVAEVRVHGVGGSHGPRMLGLANDDDAVTLVSAPCEDVHSFVVRAESMLVSAPSTLVYLYGPPAVGKLTVATELHARTGFRLFHNHLTVDAIKAVFDFASDPFIEVIRRVRLDVFEVAARNGVDVIFTNNSAWGVPNGRALFVAFAEETRCRVEAAGGRVVFVQLTAPATVLEERVSSDARHKRGKLVNRDRLTELLRQLDPAPLQSDDLLIDTSALPAPEAAIAIVRHLARGTDKS